MDRRDLQSRSAKVRYREMPPVLTFLTRAISQSVALQDGSKQGRLWFNWND